MFKEKHRYIHERVTVAYPQIGSKTMSPGFQYALEKLYGDAVGQVWDGKHTWNYWPQIAMNVTDRVAVFSCFAQGCDDMMRKVQAIQQRIKDCVENPAEPWTMYAYTRSYGYKVGGEILIGNTLHDHRKKIQSIRAGDSIYTFTQRDGWFKMVNGHFYTLREVGE